MGQLLFEILYMDNHQIFTTAHNMWYYWYPQFTDEETVNSIDRISFTKIIFVGCLQKNSRSVFTDSIEHVVIVFFGKRQRRGALAFPQLWWISSFYLVASYKLSTSEIFKIEQQLAGWEWEGHGVEANQERGDNLGVGAEALSKLRRRIESGFLQTAVFTHWIK